MDDDKDERGQVTDSMWDCYSPSNAVKDDICVRNNASVPVLFSPGKGEIEILMIPLNQKKS